MAITHEPDPGAVGGTESDHALELARFLRTRRDRITPDQVGLPTGLRRRSQGLRREEVAILAGVSPTWYTYLEQGRKIRPSPEVLDSLAGVLRLTPEERRYVHLLALGHPPTGVESVPVPTDPGILQTMIDSIGAGPDPVYVGNEYGDVIAWNEATTTWFTDFSRLPPERRNMLWWLLTAPEARRQVVDWAEETQDVVGRMRAAWASRPHDPGFDRTVAYLSAASPEFRTWWTEAAVTSQATRLRTLQSPILGRRTFRIMVLRLMDASTNSVVLHLPEPT